MLDSTYDEVFEFEATHWWYVGRRAIIKKNMEFIISKTMNAQGLQKRTILVMHFFKRGPICIFREKNEN